MKTITTAATAAFLLATTLAAAPAGPVDMLRDSEREIITLLYDTPDAGKSPVETLRPVVGKYFDTTGMTRRVIGPAWRGYTPAQRERVTALFTDLVLNSYAGNFRPGARPAITYGTVTPTSDNPPRVRAATVLEYEGKQYNVTYCLEQLPAGWRVFDIIGEGVSLIGNYQAQFKSLVAKGPDAVIAALAKNAAASKGAAP
ncbi:MAG: ABC transporter substrate-binding protein [Opitutaceae bacterium]|jgi:phospholipid transport system substrate-binding protein|nr:ABC transporter substrate-binding protein [Opitutaceae bacterium]